MDRTKLTSCCAVAASLLVLSLSSCGGDDLPTVGVFQYVSATPLNQSLDGFKAALVKGGFVEGETVKFNVQNAEGNDSNLSSIASSLVASSDLVFGIATPSAQALKEANERADLDVPVVFTAVTNPVGASLVTSMENHPENVTGMSDITDPAFIAKTLVEFKAIDKVALLYTTSESNSVYQKDLMIAALANEGIDYEDDGVSSDNMITTTISGIGDDVDAIYIPTDNHIVAAIGQVKTAVQNLYDDSDGKRSVVTICADSSVVAESCMIGIGVDYTELGEEAGAMAVDILNGTKTAKDIDCKTSAKPVMMVNTKVATDAGVTIPQSVIDGADEVFE